MKFESLLVCALSLMVSTSCAFADDSSDAEAVDNSKELFKEFVLNKTKKDRDSFVGDNFFIKEGVLANKETREVEIPILYTGLTADDIIEFLVITANSGQDYEALFIAHATATDICEAIEFVGVKKGRSVDYPSNIFWPKGERLIPFVKDVESGEEFSIMDFVFEKSDKKEQESVRLGFIYLGDKVGKDETGKTVSKVDSNGPGSIISLYNESFSVLDYPNKGIQADVYESFLAGKNVGKLSKEKKYVLILRPEVRLEADGVRTRDYNCKITPAGIIVNGKPEITDADFIKSLKDEINPKIDFYTNISWDGDCSIQRLINVMNIMGFIESRSFRIEPGSGDSPLYYRAFLPNPKWRDRAERYSQPFELHITRNDGVLKTTLTTIKEIWKDDVNELEPTLEFKEDDISAETFITTLEKAELWKSGENRILDMFKKNNVKTSSPLFVFIDADIKYKDISSIIREASKIFSIVYFFTNDTTK